MSFVVYDSLNSGFSLRRTNFVFNAPYFTPGFESIGLQNGDGVTGGTYSAFEVGLGPSPFVHTWDFYISKIQTLILATTSTVFTLGYADVFNIPSPTQPTGWVQLTQPISIADYKIPYLFDLFIKIPANKYLYSFTDVRVRMQVYGARA